MKDIALLTPFLWTALGLLIAALWDGLADDYRRYCRLERKHREEQLRQWAAEKQKERGASLKINTGVQNEN